MGSTFEVRCHEWGDNSDYHWAAFPTLEEALQCIKAFYEKEPGNIYEHLYVVEKSEGGTESIPEWDRNTYEPVKVNQIEKALQIALNAHKGQTDLDGKPVILHPLAVGLDGDYEQEIAAGFLHDVVEDTDWTFEMLLENGISEEIVDALRLLTHTKETSYLEYVQNIKDSDNDIAKAVKFHDLCHNLKRGKRGGHWKQVRKHQEALALLTGKKWFQQDSEAWDMLMDDPEEGPYWRVRFLVEIKDTPLAEALKQVGISQEEYSEFEKS